MDVVVVAAERGSTYTNAKFAATATSFRRAVVVQIADDTSSRVPRLGTVIE